MSSTVSPVSTARTASTARTRRLAGAALAAAVTATTVSLVPTPAQAQDAAVPRSALTVTSLGDQVTLTNALTGVLGSLSSTDVLFTRPGATWEFEHPATTLTQLAAPLTFDADDPTEVLRTVRLPDGLGSELPDGTYTVRTVTSLLGLLPLSSNTVETTIERFTAPSPPTGVSLDVLQGFASWLPPTSNGGAAVEEYLVRLTGAAGTLEEVSVKVGEPLRVALGALSSQVTNVYVIALNSVGQSLPGSARADLAPPSAPTGVSATPGDARATVRWSPSSSGMAVASYTVTATPGGASCTTAGTTCDVTGLVNGRAYTFDVTPQGAMQGQTSAPSAPVTPSTVPGSPASLAVASVGHDSATLRWTAPQGDGGAPVTGYTVTVGDRSFTTTGTELTVTGLQEKTTYAAGVVARNANGASASPATTGFTTTATPALAATVAPKAKRVGRKAALVQVDLTRAATVTVRVVRGAVVASRTVTLTEAPTSVSVPVTRKTRTLLNGRRVVLEVLTADGTVLASTAGTVRR